MQISDIEIWGKIPIETAKRIDKVEGLPLDFVTRAIQCQNGKYYLKPSAIYPYADDIIISEEDEQDDNFDDWVCSEFSNLIKTGVDIMRQHIHDEALTDVLNIFCTPKLDRSNNVFYVVPYNELEYVISKEDVTALLCCKTQDLSDLSFVCTNEMYQVFCWLHFELLRLLYKYECINGRIKDRYTQWLLNIIQKGYANNVAYLKVEFGSTMQVLGISQRGKDTTLYIKPLKPKVYERCMSITKCALNIVPLGKQ